MITLIQFFRELKKEKTRILLTLFAIAWGTGCITFLLAAGDGLMSSLIEGFEGMGKAIVLVRGGETSKAYQGLKTGRRIRLREEDVVLIKERINGIKYISPEYERGATLKYEKNIINTSLHGIWPDYSPMRYVLPQPGGRFISQLDVESRRRVIFLGNEVKKRLFEDEDAVGKTILMNYVPFTVIGIRKPKVQNNAYTRLDRDNAFIPASTYRVMVGARYLNNMIYSPENSYISEQVKDQVYRVLGRRHKFDHTDRTTLNLWDTVSQDDEFAKVTIGVQMFFGIIGLLTLIVAGVGLANIMYAMVKNRTREIGIKLAVGAKRRHIIGEYIIQSLLTVFIGGTIGMTISWAVIELIALIPLEHETFQYLGKPYPVMSFTTAIVVTLILGIIGFAAGIFPARRAAAINPAEALRYE
jgi:putative ABC transport system permease protein